MTREFSTGETESLLDEGFLGGKSRNIHHAWLNFDPGDCIWFLAATYLTIETRVLNNEVRIP